MLGAWRGPEEGVGSGEQGVVTRMLRCEHTTKECKLYAGPAEPTGHPGGPAELPLGVHGSPQGPAVSVGPPRGPAARPVRVYRSPWTRALQSIRWESMGHPLGPAESVGLPRPGPCSVCGSPQTWALQSLRVTPDLGPAERPLRVLGSTRTSIRYCPHASLLPSLPLTSEHGIHTLARPGEGYWAW